MSVREKQSRYPALLATCQLRLATPRCEVQMCAPSCIYSAEEIVQVKLFCFFSNRAERLVMNLCVCAHQTSQGIKLLRSNSHIQWISPLHNKVLYDDDDVDLYDDMMSYEFLYLNHTSVNCISLLYLLI